MPDCSDVSLHTDAIVQCSFEEAGEWFQRDGEDEDLDIKVLRNVEKLDVISTVPYCR